jgi:hypothetical protein
VEVGGLGEVGAGGERGEVGDGVGDGRRRLGRVERRLPRAPVVFGDGRGVIGGGESHGAEAAEEAAERKKHLLCREPAARWSRGGGLVGCLPTNLVLQLVNYHKMINLVLNINKGPACLFSLINVINSNP